MAQSRRTTEIVLPNEVIIEILTWLPVKSLLKFKCVCRSWRALISSQRFIKAHLHNSKLAPNLAHDMLAFACRPGNFRQCSVNSMLYESVSQVSDLSYPFELVENYRVMGTCNGLLLVRLNYTEVILWNPSTRTCKKLPHFGVELAEDDLLGDFGLGYDKSKDDYKVVGFFDTSSGCSAFANGKLYYFTKPEYGSDWEILSIDLEKEEYEILQMPSNVKLDDDSCMAVSEGSLFLLWPHPTFAAADVWMLDGCSVGIKNWTKVVSIPCRYDNGVMYTHFTQLLYVLKNGLVMFRNGRTFVVYDAKDGSFRYPRIRDMGECRSFGVHTYVESLVSPVG
ncbi:F-box/kelch-repeat protein At3g23880-like isoform X2 [Salvia miltiorrhiza]|uniref:F-box/kelch-repeat protein At3g23880-like isoform X2 n=1 Tax=Salvia miltiorrhiza TaxID=226208 RepID=UPI0025AC2240|nr:F-box/kelch-repeat protein At3g23880-like isoform X2 [Salvia miltiorrhiza]